ncbi:DNA polymerase-3 subunit gamma/tau [Bacilli bacterium PM5-9]|nr:DNA polymerase-3 subunit gamma/tau [Bacilli bacterium PM5-9]
MYQSLYRKYRPQTFNDIYGQDAISQTLTNAIIYDKVAHAYLFSGPRGTGKTSTAKLLAKALNCTNIVDGRICDECENCLLVKENNHPDVIEIDAASNNGVDEVRDLIEKVKYAPIKGKKKVYIIDEVHMMSQGAFNALLKTLEEPPEHVVFILATTEQHKVLPTIRSRCQKFNFKKLSEKDIINCLKDVLLSEDCPYDEEALKIISSLCDGGMRDALSLLEQVMIYSNNDISIQATNEALDLVAEKKIEELYNLIIEKKLNDALDYVNELSKKSVDYKQIINEIIKKTMNELIEIKAKQSIDNKQYFLLNMIEKFDESLEKLKYDNSKKLYLDLAIIKSINYGMSTPVIQFENDSKQSENETKEIIEPVIEKIVEPEIESNNIIIEPEVTDSEPEVIDSELEQDVSDNEDFIIEQQVEQTINRVVNNVIDEDEIMNVLVQASRNDLDFVKSKWSLLEDYLININTKKNAGLLIESVPVAASSKAIIVVCSESSEVTLINNPDNIMSISSFIKEMMDEERYCFAITKENWKILKDKYLQLRQVNRLPKAKTILEDVVLKSNEIVKEKPEKENELLKFGKELFEDKLVIKREDDINEY